MPELNSPCRSSTLHAGAQSPCRSSNLHAGAQSTALSESGTDKEVSSVYETPYDCFAFRGQMASTKAIVANCSSSRKAMSVHAHGKPRRPDEGRNQWHSVARRRNQRRPHPLRAAAEPEDAEQSVALSGNQTHSVAIRRNRWQSDALRGNQTDLRMRSRQAARAFGPAKRRRPSEGRGPPKPPPHTPHKRASCRP